jgi:hypothetical protein
MNPFIESLVSNTFEDGDWVSFGHRIPGSRLQKKLFIRGSFKSIMGQLSAISSHKANLPSQALITGTTGTGISFFLIYEARAGEEARAVCLAFRYRLRGGTEPRGSPGDCESRSLDRSRRRDVHTLLKRQMGS